MKKKVLLAEDDLFLGKLSQKKFELADFEVIFLKDGTDVLSLAQKEKPAVIVLDLMMPNRDGFQVLNDLKNHPEVSAIPVVVVTALSTDQDRHKVADLGAKKYFVKSDVQIGDIVKYLKLLVA